MGIHSYSDFNLHIPANFMMMISIAAIGYSALNLEKRYHTEKILYNYEEAERMVKDVPAAIISGNTPEIADPV